MRTRGVSGIVGIIVVVWLLIGVLAVWMRGYFNSGPANCASTVTIATTVLAGPLNWKLNPAANCDVNVNVPPPKQ
ncbi:MAG TPA: hypothetical protein VME67_05715 [Mycobacterium sp.]|nr:hypothetical protein [Mycobacterium sp.]HTX94367.1 hypothetical protein [Mycobacterium sp.]